MKVAVYSDIHDNITNLEKCLSKIKELGIRQAICLGDFISPGMVKQIIAASIPTYAIWGNNDGEKVIITKVSLESENIFEIANTTHSEYELEGKKLFLSHYPEGMKSIAKSGDYDAVFYGHDHEQHYEKLENGTIFANPGEISGHASGDVTFMVWDSDENECELIKLNV